jgi:signal transduction histidine kinase
VSLRADDSWVYLTITDHGVGIAPEDHPKLFQKFSRIDNPRSIIVGGNGLGLYLAKRIVDAHGGSISVESEVGAGTTFTLQLPRIAAKV